MPKYAGQYVTIPLKTRFLALNFWHLLMLVFSVVSLFFASEDQAPPERYFWGALGIFLLWGTPTALLMWIHRRVYVLSKDGEADKKADEMTKLLKGNWWDPHLRRWYVRYPAAVAIAAFGWWLFNDGRTMGMVAGVVYMGGALFVARELGVLMLMLALLAVGIAALYGVFSLFSGLSLVGAVLVGACIIAWAILKSGKKGRSE